LEDGKLRLFFGESELCKTRIATVTNTVTAFLLVARHKIGFAEVLLNTVVVLQS
jgi:hypothetical protein